MGTFIVLAILFLAYIALVGSAVLYLLVACLRALKLPVPLQRSVAACLGTIILTPALAPAGNIAAIPLPLGILLSFVHSAKDLAFLIHQWQFLVPSVLITSAICSYIVWRVLPNSSSKRTRLPRAA